MSGPAVHGSLTIPQFSYLNASPEGTYGHENWGTPSGLTPTWSGEAVDPRTYTLLAPHDADTVQEAGTSPDRRRPRHRRCPDFRLVPLQRHLYGGESGNAAAAP